MHDKPCPTLVKLLDLPEDERLLGPYRLVQQLGRGGFAPVWLAREIHGKREFRTVAIKLFCVEQGAGGTGFSLAGREQIVEEARALCQVEHPNIVRFYSFQTDPTGDVLGIVMEYARGSSLDRKLQNDGKLPVADVLSLGTALASALAEVHRAGLVHRDVKPGNVIESKGSFKLIDFGIAAGAQRSKRDAQMTRIVLRSLPQDVKGARLTAFADTLLARGDRTFEGSAEIPSGTLGYIDPDCIAHLSPATAMSDLYSLGALLYECLTGMVPAAAAAIVTGEGGLKPEVVDGREQPPPVLDVAPEVPERLAHLIDALLNAEAGKRPSSAAELRDALEKIREELAAPQPSKEAIAAASKRESPAARGLGAILAGGLVVGTFVAIWIASRAASAPPTPSTATPATVDTAPPVAVNDAAPPAPSETPVVPPPESPVSLLVSEGQALLTEGDFPAALSKFRAARALELLGGPTAEAGAGHGLAQLFVDHVTLATSTQGPCTLRAFSHPRLGYATSHTFRPSVAAVPRGAVVVWTDDHEKPGAQMKAYSVMIDTTGHPTSKTRDLTPEGEWIYRPSLLSDGDRVVLLYWDGRGQYPGVHVRWLNPDGRIAGPTVLVDRGSPANLWPVMAKTPDGFVVAWQDDRVHEGSDQVFLRHLDKNLEPVGGEALATHVGLDAGARTPSLAASSDSLLLAYTIDKGKSQRLIALRRYALGDASVDTWKNLPALIVGTDRIAPEAPHVACGHDGCFVVWHGAPTEAYAGLIDVTTGKRIWHKKFASSGGHPAVAANANGDLMVAYFDQKEVKVASLSGDGVGPPSVVGRVSGAGTPHDPPRPWLAPGREQGEWYVAWQEADGGEPLVARVTCKM